MVSRHSLMSRQSQHAVTLDVSGNSQIDMENSGATAIN
jgi:hypothetical protein